MASQIDDLTDDELDQLMALPEAERNAVLNQLGEGAPPDISMGAEGPVEPEGSALGRFVSGAAEQLNPLAALQGLGQAIAHPIDTATAIAGQMGEQWEKAGAAGNEGRWSEAIGHGLAGSLPLVGPAAANIGEKIGAGDVAGGLGSATGLIASIGAPRALAAGKTAAGRGISAVSEPIGRGLKRSQLVALQGGGPVKVVARGLAEAISKGGVEGRIAELQKALKPAKEAKSPKPPKPKLKPETRARVEHAAKRSVKVLGEEAVEAPKAVPSDLPVEEIVGNFTKRVETMHKLGIAPSDIAKSLQKAYVREGRGAGLSVGKMRSMVDEVIKATPEEMVKAVKSLPDEMADRVIKWAQPGGLDSRAKMDAALRELYPDVLTPAKARKVVDFILDDQKIGPKRTAAEMGIPTNEQIRTLRAGGTLPYPIHKGR